MGTSAVRIVFGSAVLALLAGQPAFATSCGWHARMEEDEGGSVLTASVCGGPKGDAQLLLTCFAKPVLSYDLGDAGQQLEPGISASFEFKAGGKTVKKTLQLEAMYNYFTLDLTRADPVLDLLRSKGEITISADRYGANSFPLAGSGAAIGKVLAQCGKAKPAGGDGD